MFNGAPLLCAELVLGTEREERKSSQGLYPQGGESVVEHTDKHTPKFPMQQGAVSGKH